ncbi:DUF4386 domain-containing protein [Actinoplanes sp. OR16]|uniref:DUF4386 domain-containing protein n=1 Tax=Actinoplanes sp. OR16 TaxID=946334 RepID=UPI000FD93AEE|nr:DUF4386 domain-containing protein [Actinoplanes sp. OR16]
MTILHSAQRSTGILFLVAVAAFTVSSSVLAATFDWPDILREPAPYVLERFHEGGTTLIVTWFAVAWTYALLAVPVLLLPAALGRETDPVLRAATAIGAASVLLSLIGFLRWVFVVPPLAAAWAGGTGTEAAWTAQHQFGGALLGEHLGQVLAVVWSVTVSVIVLRDHRALGVAGLIASTLYLLNQGDVLATAIPGFPVWDAAGPVGSTAWGLWIAALGAVLLARGRKKRETAARAVSREGSSQAATAIGTP